MLNKSTVTEILIRALPVQSSSPSSVVNNTSLSVEQFSYHHHQPECFQNNQSPVPQEV